MQPGSWAAASGAWARGARWMDGWMGWQGHGGTADRTGRGDRKECIIQMSQSKRGFKAGNLRRVVGAAAGARVLGVCNMLCGADMAQRASEACAHARAAAQAGEPSLGAAAQHSPDEAHPAAGLLAGAEPRLGARGGLARCCCGARSGLHLGHRGLHRVLVGGCLGGGAGAVLELGQHRLPLLGGLQGARWGGEGGGEWGLDGRCQVSAGRQVHRAASLPAGICPSALLAACKQPAACAALPPCARTCAQDRSCAMQRSRMALKEGVPYTSDARRMVWATASARERVGGAHQEGERRGVSCKRSGLWCIHDLPHALGWNAGTASLQALQTSGEHPSPAAVQSPTSSPPLPPTGVRVGEAVGVHGAHLEASHTLLHSVNQAAGGGHQGHGAVLQRGVQGGAGQEVSGRGSGR